MKSALKPNKYWEKHEIDGKDVYLPTIGWKIFEVIKGYEPVNNKEEFGFYWEWQQIKDCVDDLMVLFDEYSDKGVST